MQLVDFESPRIPVLQDSEVNAAYRDDKATQAIVAGWIRDGLVRGVDSATPDAVYDLLVLTDAGRLQCGLKPLDAAAEKPAPKPARPKPLRGVGWITTPLEFTDGLELPIGTKVTAFDAKQPHHFSGDDVAAAKACAKRIAHETGDRPLVAAIGGYLRVLERRFLSVERGSVQ